MQGREYYGIRQGFVKHDDNLKFEMLRKALRILYKDFHKKGYFQKYFGIECVDGYSEGLLGDDIATRIYLETSLPNGWPFLSVLDELSEVGLFTMVEYLHDHCARPVTIWEHNFNSCGVHVEEADDEFGRLDFREEANKILRRYRNVELSESGEILENAEEGFEKLFQAELPTENEILKQKVSRAVTKFRRATALMEERKEAVRELADVLEHMREKIKKLPMSKDESDLFNIANNFGIRHFNERQKTEYGKVWLNWIFYCYLSTIHTCHHLVKESGLE